MGREVRMIKPGWEHPRNGFYHDGSPRYVGLFAGPFSEDRSKWEFAAAQWEAGLKENWSPNGSTWEPKTPELEGMTYADWAGACPQKDEYMPEWAPGEATKFVMYEDTSEGTPISPAFDSPHELARWLANTGASAFGGMTTTYESWLATITRGWSVGMIATADGIMPGTDLP